ncbi:MAG: ATP-binding cassette domain-containing protein [Pseudomonadales bacterium]|nr:ATP-binding cassette domain-containing protein [Pseudomonadales bacterium]
MAFVDVRNLWKRYPGKTVLENVRLRVDEQEFVTIVGASGCGKTTFLRMLLGEVEPCQGVIEIDGERLVPEPRADRGVVFQRYSVFPHLNVLANVLLGLDFGASALLGRTFGRRRALDIERAERMLDRVGLLSSAKNYPAELSGGMQQRLALAQTLITEPGILLLDEPFGALDPGIRADMHDLVRELHRELGLTVFMVTHDIAEGFSLGSRLLVFDKPRIDPHEPDLYGATITFDLPVGQRPDVDSVVNSINVRQEA